MRPQDKFEVDKYLRGLTDEEMEEFDHRMALQFAETLGQSWQIAWSTWRNKIFGSVDYCLVKQIFFSPNLRGN